jgi:gliding motility-associated-like protein
VHKGFVVFVLGCICLFSQSLHAQKEGAVWYFGQNAGLDFNEYYPRPLTDGQITTREGVASICDKDGQLLFYTDGQKVYNRNHAIMDNGDGLFGDASSTQSSIIVPKPGSTTEYYIFTVDQAVSAISPNPALKYNGLNYSVVDLSVNTPYGRVTQKNIQMPGTTDVLFTEKITVVKHKNGQDYWIIAHQFGTWAFYEFKLTNGGVVLDGAVTAGSEHRIDETDRNNRGATGYLKSSPKGDFLAAAVEGMKFFELFSFNNSTGEISLIANLPAGDPGNPSSKLGAAYGVEFSPTGNFLYGSTRKEGIIYQWDISLTSESAINKSVQFIRPPTSVLCGALQLGPNGKIYVSLSGQPYLGVINSPIQQDCHYLEHGASLMNNATGEGGKAYFGLPTFLSDFFQAAQFYYENTCQNDFTNFYMSANKYTIDGLPSWDIYDETGNILIGKATVDPQTFEGSYRFTIPGKYLVKFKVNQFGGIITQDQLITVHPLPELNFPDTTSMCKGSPALLDAGDGAFYRWRDNQNLNVDRYRTIYNPGKYSVTVTSYNGCSNTDSTVVEETPLPVIKDTLVSLAGCGIANGSITLDMDLGADQYDFVWKQFPANNTNRAQNLSFGVYDVTITSRITGCSLVSKISVSEKDAPAVDIHASVTGPSCPGSKVTLKAEGGANYLWENPAGVLLDTVSVYPLKTTTYRVKGFSVDPLTQKECSAFGELTVEVFTFNNPQLGADKVGCQGDTIGIDGGGDYVSWKWSNKETTRLVEITQSIPQLIVYVTDKNNCVLTDTTSVLIKPLPAISLGEDIIKCKSNPISLTGGVGDFYSWSPGGDTTASIQVNETGTYHLTIRKNGCTNTDSIQVTIKPLPKVNLNMPRDTSLCLTDSIKLSGGKGDSYLWSSGETLPEIYVKESGQYILTVKLDNCANSDTVNLTVNPQPKVDLGKDSVYCKSNPIRLSGDDGASDSYLWNTGATGSFLMVDTTGNYSLTVGKKGCYSSDTVMIRVNDPAKLVIDSVSTSPVSCPGNRDGSLLIYARGTGTSYEYSIDGGSSYFDSPLFQGLNGNYNFQIVVKEDGACTVNYSKDIMFEEPDSILIKYRLVSPSCETCPDGEINLRIEGGTPPYSVKWSTNDTITYLSNMILGKYLVWVTDSERCRQSALIDLNLDYPPFQIPNAFTPNGDGVNERWEIAALQDFPDCLVKIYNRAGKLIWWSETGYPVAWDGIDKSGNMMPVGSYYYLVWLSIDLKPLKGSVSILR